MRNRHKEEAMYGMHESENTSARNNTVIYRQLKVFGEMRNMLA